MGRRNSNTADTEFLLPADVDEILDKFGHYLKSYSPLNDRESVFANYKRTMKRLDVLFPLKEHPIHGITGLHAIEIYDEDGYVRQYHYQWKVIIPKMGIQMSHISGWGNDPHDADWTPEEYKVKTEPHHHHYDPNDRRKRRENYDVRSLEQAFNFVIHYINSELPYTP